jgi:selenocysteine-specific elongation factor
MLRIGDQQAPGGSLYSTPMNDTAPSPRTFVVGTAGHVDHGKSTLVKALTGIDPDRLAEEKARAMTIDLGFAWLTTPAGRQVSVVDVPGHERFIKNMLAGVGGIDAALLIVAADEGPMPQTDEHLAILDLLRVESGLVVLTKADAVDGDWLDLVREETRERVAGTVLANAPLVAVSALTGAGLADLLGALDGVLTGLPARPSGGTPRLPIDRVFTVAGFGTVATGTLLGGELSVGQELRVYPRQLATRVRGLQTHQSKLERASPGSRTAVNLAGLAVDDLRRGDVLAPPGALKPTTRLDVRLRLLPEAPLILEQNAAVDFFVGAAELPARLTLLDAERLEPGQSGWVQVRLAEPVAVERGDRFIVRRPSPSLTIGGGEVVDPHPPRHRRFRADVLDSLEVLAAGGPEEIVLQAIGAPVEVRELLSGGAGGLPAEQVQAAVTRLLAAGQARALGRVAPATTPRPADYLLSAASWERLANRLVEALTEFHAGFPLRRGMPKELLKGRLRLAPARLFEETLATAGRDGLIVDEGQSVRLAGFAIRLDGERRALADRYLAGLTAAPYAPPAPAELGVDPDTLGALVDLGEVVKVAEGVVYAPAAFAAIEREVLRLIDRDGSLTLATFRDHFATSRKYAQATLEFLDQRRVTRRVGDERVRYAGAGAAPSAVRATAGPVEERS